MSKIEFKGQNVAPFTAWLKRFSIFSSKDLGLLIEIDTQTEEFIAKNYSSDRSIVKMSSISFADLELTTKNRPINKRIKVGIYDISKIQRTLAQFSDEFDLSVNYAKSVDDEGTENLAGTSILIKDEILKAGWECSSLSIFSYISDEIFKNVISNLEEESVASFDLKKEDRERIMTLCDLDKEYGKMSFKVKDKIIYARSKSFELQLGIIDHSDLHFPITKKQFSKIDSENYHVETGSTRMVLESTDSNTVVVIGKLDENEWDDEKDIDLG